MSKKTWIYVGFFTLLFGGFYAFLYGTIDTSQSRLPVLSNVKAFDFVRQDSVTVTQKDVEGKVYVSEFFFTTCPGICPKMNTNMKKVYEVLKGENDFMILSHTVDPANDSVARLKYYADSLGADMKNWWFLTGTKQELYKSARESYIVDDPKNNADNISEEFLHNRRRQHRAAQCGGRRPAARADPRHRLSGRGRDGAVYKRAVFGANAGGDRAERRHLRRYHQRETMSVIHGSPGRSPLRQPLRRRWRMAVCAALLPCLVTACVGVKVRPVHTLPQPLVQPMPVKVGLVLDEELRTYTHDESRGGTDWKVELGAGHEKFFHSIFGYSFEGLEVFPSIDAARVASGLQAIFLPQIEQYSFATASETSGSYWAVTIRYRISVFSPAGEPIDTLVLTGYGSAPGSGRSTSSLTAATGVAIRDAAAKFLVQMPQQPLARRMRDGQLLAPSDDLGAAVDVVEAVPIDPVRPPG